MNIRKATKNDMPQVLELIQELAIFEKEPDAVVVTVDDLVRDGFSENPLFQCFVAEVENEIIGMALYYYRYKLAKDWTQDEYKEKLLDRVFTSISIFDNVLHDVELIDYSLKRNKTLLEELIRRKLGSI